MSRSEMRRHVELIEFARRLTATIEALGYSKAAFARSVGVEPGRLHHWTIGGNYPGAEILLEITRVHGISCDWLLSGRLSALPADVAQKTQRVLEKRGAAAKRPLVRD